MFADGGWEELAGALFVVIFEATAILPFMAWTNAYRGRHGRGQHRARHLRKSTPWPYQRAHVEQALVGHRDKPGQHRR